jgi:hypothetical protein
MSAIARRPARRLLVLLGTLLLASGVLLAGPLRPAPGPEQGAPAELTAVLLDGDPGGYVFSGTRLWTTPTDVVNLSGSREGVVASAGGYYVSLYSGPGRVLAPGTFDGARRSTFYSTPGIDIHGNGMGCNMITGRFVIHEAVFDDTGKPTRFAASMEQHCEHGIRGLYGEIRYRSSIPFAALASTPTSLSFAEPQPGQPPADVTATVRNLGTTEQRVTAAVSGLDAADFTIASTTCAPALAPGASCELRLRYRGTDTEAASAVLTIRDGTFRGWRSVPLSGYALPSSSVALRVDRNPVPAGTAVALTAEVSPPTAAGDVEFRSERGVIGRAHVDDGRATLSTDTLAPGTYWVTATYLGDGTRARSTSVPFRLIVRG